MENKEFIITEQNVEEYVCKIAKWIKQKVGETGVNGVVLGMSSGVDCSVVSRLCQEAQVNTHLVIMPYGDTMNKSKSYEHAMELINKFRFDYHVYNIKPAVDALMINEGSGNIELAQANLRPRVRMTYLYQYAQLNNLLVIGTGNLSERTVGYSTKWGDGACDFNPLASITKSEVYILAKYLQIPNCIIDKKPSAELWEGQTDEDELGITYDKIDDFILYGTTGNKEEDNLINSKKQRALHKISPIPSFNEKIKKIAIIVAVDQELAAMKQKLEKIEEKKLRDLTYYEGSINGKEYIVIKSGIGKVNAARTTQMLIDTFELEHIVNIGSAGSLNDELEIGDIVIGKELVQHDFDTTAFGDEKGYITGAGKIFKSDEKLVEKYKSYVMENKLDYKAKAGTIASGDIFLTEKIMKEKIRSKFGADCVEMEGAAIAQICALNKVPFIVIRSISDKPNGSNQMDYEQFADLASKRCADLIIKFH